jgi:hypothetical protein
MRFVVLEHDHPVLHWDLMLEAGAVLQTWRLAAPPEVTAGPIEATPLGDHRRMYLDYEGPVSGNRGAVKRWDAGTFSDEIESTPASRRLRFAGARLTGTWRLACGAGGVWRFEFTAPPE